MSVWQLNMVADFWRSISIFTLLTGRMDEDDITAFLSEKEIDLVIDATHPFAVLVTGNIKRACERTRGTVSSLPEGRGIFGRGDGANR